MFWSSVRPDKILPPIPKSAAVTTSLEADELAVGMITCEMFKGQLRAFPVSVFSCPCPSKCSRRDRHARDRELQLWTDWWIVVRLCARPETAPARITTRAGPFSFRHIATSDCELAPSIGYQSVTTGGMNMAKQLI